MKNLIVAALVLVGSFAYGSHTVCSSPSLYYSSSRIDSGPVPPPGTEVGRLTVVGEGKVLVDQAFIQGVGDSPSPQYQVEFIGPKEVLSQSGGQVAGAVVYRHVAVLSTAAPLPPEEVLRTQVVCERAWAFVP